MTSDSLVSCPALSRSLWQYFQGTLHPPWQFFCVGFYLVLVQLALLYWPPLVHEKCLSIFCPAKAVTLSYSPPKSYTDYLLSSEFPRLERDTSPLSTLLTHRTQRDFTCRFSSLKLSSRPGLGEAGPQEKLTEKQAGLRISSNLQS